MWTHGTSSSPRLALRQTPCEPWAGLETFLRFCLLISRVELGDKAYPMGSLGRFARQRVAPRVWELGDHCELMEAVVLMQTGVGENSCRSTEYLAEQQGPRVGGSQLCTLLTPSLPPPSPPSTSPLSS